MRKLDTSAITPLNLLLSESFKMTSESQNKQILAYLQEGKTLTALEALSLFSCFRLASRINDLRKKGHDIKSEMVEVESGKKVARYSI